MESLLLEQREQLFEDFLLSALFERGDPLGHRRAHLEAAIGDELQFACEELSSERSSRPVEAAHHHEAGGLVDDELTARQEFIADAAPGLSLVEDLAHLRDNHVVAASEEEGEP